ncbi:MAG: NADH-quinone oxidoreductase subunit L [Nitrospirae bacterium]|nr:MAG: NADH-quinone oxidoreductase subunit L [Nitrospirota bacterium]
MTDLYALIPLLPLSAFLMIAFGGAGMNARAQRIGVPCVIGAWALSLLAAWEVAVRGPFSLSGYRFIHVGELDVALSLYVDQLTAALLVLVTTISSVVHLYAPRYMHGDVRYRRFFAVIALYTFSMIMVVMSANLLLLYAFWEILGLCSYLVISHYSERLPACRAATTTFLVNAVASVGMGLGVILAFATFGTLDIPSLLSQVSTAAGQTIDILGWAGLEWSMQASTLIAVLLFMGAVGKSSQFPFHVWLPLAMESPTPGTTLTATMVVNAGVYLVARLSPLFLESSAAMIMVTVVGALTALLGGCLALVHSDIKRVLAYSTMSQIGYMMFACGLGAYVLAIYHLCMHGVFKAYLFLSTGNTVSQLAARPRVGAERWAYAPARLGTIPIGALLLAMIPPLVIFSSPYAQLWETASSPAAQWAYWGIGLATVFLTSWYIFRGMARLIGTWSLVFSEHQDGEGQSWLAPAVLMVLGVGGLITLGVLIGIWSWFQAFLSPVFAQQGRTRLFERGLWDGSLGMVVPFLVALAGWGLAYAVQVGVVRFPMASHAKQVAYVFFLNRGYVDDLYHVGVVKPTMAFARWLWKVVDVGGIDQAVTGIGAISLGTARWLWHVVDIQGIDRSLKRFGQASILLARWLWRVVDLGGIDRTVTEVGTKSQGLGKWLWQRVDTRGMDRGLERVGMGAQEAGETLEELEPRMLQHHLLVLIFWMVLVLAIVFWLIF